MNADELNAVLGRALAHGRSGHAGFETARFDRVLDRAVARHRLVAGGPSLETVMRKIEAAELRRSLSK